MGLFVLIKGRVRVSRTKEVVRPHSIYWGLILIAYGIFLGFFMKTVALLYDLIFFGSLIGISLFFAAKGKPIVSSATIEKDKKTKRNLFILFIVVVLAIAFLGTIYWQYQKMQKEELEGEITIPESHLGEIIIFSPQKNEKWTVGEKHTIRWLPNLSSEKVGIILSDKRYSTASLSKVWQVENIKASGFYSFTVPELVQGDEYQFYVSTKDKQGYSDLFSIKPSSKNWRVYEWSNFGSSFSFRYPPDWTVERIYYQTPAQQVRGEIPENIGLMLSPNKELGEGNDYISIGGRQESCGPEKKYTRCFTVEYFPIFTYSNNSEVFSVFDAVAESFLKSVE
jgi:hypothetical protein